MKLSFKGLRDFRFRKRIFSFELEFNLWIGLILLLGMILRFYNLSHRGIYYWDEGEYLDAAESVLEGKYQWLGVGLKPLHNLLILISFLVFGNHDYVALGQSAFVGTITIYLVYLIGRKLFDNKTGLFASLFLAVTEYHIYYSRSALADANLTFFFVLTLLFYTYSVFEDEKKYLYLSGVGVWLCFLTRNTGAFVLIVMLLSELILLQKRIWRAGLQRMLILATIPVALIFLTLYIYQNLGPPSLVELKSTGKLASILSLIFGGFSVSGYYLRMTWWMVSPIVIFSAISGLAYGFKNRTKGDVIIIVWFSFLFLFLSQYPVHRHRIFLPAIPALALLASRGFFVFKNNKIVYSMILLVILTGLGQAYDTISFSNPGYRETADFIKRDGGVGVIASNLGVSQYYYEEKPLSVYFLDNVKKKEDFTSLSDMGYSYLVLDWMYMYDRWSNEDLEFDRQTFRRELVENIHPAFVTEDNSLYDLTDLSRTHEQMVFVQNQLRADPLNYKIYVFRLHDVVTYLNNSQREISNDGVP